MPSRCWRPRSREWTPGEIGLDAAYESAVAVLEAIETQQAEIRRNEQAAAQERAGLAARVEALNIGLTRKDATSALLAATDQLDGLFGVGGRVVERAPRLREGGCGSAGGSGQRRGRSRPGRGCRAFGPSQGGRSWSSWVMPGGVRRTGRVARASTRRQLRR